MQLRLHKQCMELLTEAKRLMKEQSRQFRSYISTPPSLAALSRLATNATILVTVPVLADLRTHNVVLVEKGHIAPACWARSRTQPKGSYHTRESHSKRKLTMLTPFCSNKIIVHVLLSGSMMDTYFEFETKMQSIKLFNTRERSH